MLSVMSNVPLIVTPFGKSPHGTAGWKPPASVKPVICTEATGLS